MNVADCVAAIVNSWEYMHSVARNIYTSNKFHFLALCCACGQSIGWHQKTPRTFNHVPNQLHQEFPIMFQISWMNHPRNSCQNKKTFNHVPNQLDESHLLAKNTKNTFNHVLNHSWMNHPRTSCQEHYDFARTMESDSTARTRIFANGKFESPKNRMLWLWIATRKSHSHSLSFTKPTAHAYMYVSIHTAI